LETKTWKTCNGTGDEGHDIAFAETRILGATVEEHAVAVVDFEFTTVDGFGDGVVLAKDMSGR